MKKVLLALPALAVAMMAVFASSGQSAEAAEVTLHVRAGDGESGYQVNMFLPETVYVRAGDTLTWDWPTDEPHSVTFGQIAGDPNPPSNPGTAVIDYDGTGFVNSGFVQPQGGSAATFSMKFTKAGAYEYSCFLHPMMTGEVVVQAPGIGEQDNQASVDGRGAATFTSAMGALKAAAGAQAAKPVAVTGSGAGKKYTLAVSSAHDLAEGDVDQFFPASLNIGVNDSIEFVSNVHTPHDIVFPGPADLNGPPPPGLETFDPFADSLNYSPGVKLDNSKPVISPMIGLDFPAGTKASFSFAKAGTYDYACILHVSLGMRGRINVTSGSPLPPNTGDSALTPTTPSGTSGLWLVFGAVGLAVAATGAAFAASRR